MRIARKFKPLEVSIIEYTRHNKRTIGQNIDHLPQRNAKYVLQSVTTLQKEGWLKQASGDSDLVPATWTLSNMSPDPICDWEIWSEGSNATSIRITG